MAEDQDRIRAALTERYAIDREIGRGGMATVYLAEDLKHHRKVAIKVLHPDVAASLGRSRFLREIEIVANLRHPGILPLYDSGEADGLLFYVMPFVEGPSLRDRLDKEKQLPVDEALRIISELAAALDEAQSHGVIHRDIKPENVLFEGDQPLIADFGVATALEEAGGEKLTRTGVAVGTPSYMSPEQAAGGEADARSDEYALACVLYEMLGGTPPFTGPTPQAVMARHALDPVPDLGTVRSTVPEGVIAAVERAMAKVPADRYPTAGAFAEALEKGEEKRRRPRARRRMLEYAIGALIVVSAGAAYLLSNRSPPTQAGPTRIAVLPFDLTGAELPDAQYAEALFADIIQRLSGAGAHVITAAGTRHYPGIERSVREVREALDADIVWLTRVETRGDSAWASAELVDAESMISLGTNTVGQRVTLLGDVVPVLSDWASGVLGLSTPGRGYEPDPEALKVFLKGQAAWWRMDEEQAGGRWWFEEAVKVDPGFAEAWGYLSMVYVQLTHGWNPCVSYPAMLPLAQEAATRALELDSTLVEPRVALGHMYWEHQFDWESGEQELRTALNKDPDHGDANLMYGFYLILAGRPDEALTYLDRAAESSQLTQRYQQYRSLALGIAGREAEAEPSLRLAVARLGTQSWAGDMLVDNLVAQGRVEEAARLAVEAGADTIANPPDEDFGVALARGNQAAVDRMIEEGAEYSPLFGALRAYQAGRHELVIPWIQEWWQEEEQVCGSRIKSWLLAYFPKLVGDPRMQVLMDEVNIPWRESEVWADLSQS